ncbi:unnamed protein product [Penicillium pancosmium]
MSSMLLKNRTQDLWGKIRFPVIKNLSNSSSEWIDMPSNNDLTYASLVGSPVATLPISSNTSFTLPGSYLSLSCPEFGVFKQPSYTNFTNSSAHSPENHDDCSWASAQGGFEYQIAISEPCSEFNLNMTTGTRNARKFVWESYDDTDTDSERKLYTRAICDLTTTFVDAKVTCTGSSSGSYAGSTCILSSVRRSPTPPVNGNWTILDFDTDGPSSSTVNTRSIVNLLAGLFPYAQSAGGDQPVRNYLMDPFTTIGNYVQLKSVSVLVTLSSNYVLNSITYFGIDPTALTASFNKSDVGLSVGLVNLNGTVTTGQDVIKCNRAWFGVLITASLVIFVFALLGAILRIMTFAPDILGSISSVFLDNKIRGVTGSSTWSSDQWCRWLKNEKL